MLDLIDNVLNRITMYRLVLYELGALVVAAVILSAVGMIGGNPLMILFSVFFITVLCWATNNVFSRLFDAPANVESVYITALILVLIIAPPSSVGDGDYLETAAWASVWAMASKYMFAFRRKHIFNPAAFGVAVTALTLDQPANWWVGTLPMLPFVALGGFLVVRKIRRADLVWSFLAVAMLGALPQHLTSLPSASRALWAMIAGTYFVFFATVMLTEPLTMPPSRKRRIAYGALTGLFCVPWFHIGSFSFSPELALLAGNVFSFLASPKGKLLLTLKEKTAAARDVFHFRFAPDRPLPFRPGQYLEWTLDHSHPDGRGNRRYLTIASSPAEPEIAIGVKFYEPASSFKKALLALQPGDAIAAGQLAGDFVLPADTTTKLAFIAGGIGITPFRSMVRDMLDRGERRPVVLLYSNRTPSDVAYRDLFDQAARDLGIKVVYTVTDGTDPGTWNGLTGRIDADMIMREIPDFGLRHFFVSGTHAMVVAFERTLRSMGVHRSRIRTDFFPGFV